MLNGLRHPQPSQVLIDIAPVFNALHSLVSVTDAIESPGIGEWAVQTREYLSDDEWLQHRIISQWIGVEALGNVARDQTAQASVPAFLGALAEKEPELLRDELLYWIVACPGARLNYKLIPQVDDHLSLLETEDAFCAFFEHPESHDEKREITRQTYEFFIEPLGLRELIIRYLGFFWEKHLKAEWERNLPELEKAIVGFKELDMTGLSHFEVIEVVTRRNLRGVYRPEVLQSYSTLRFIPSSHSGPYILKTSDGQELRITFGARHLTELAQGAKKLDSGYVVEQMRALADETRLEIIRMLKVEEELGTQDIIDRLDLSKSAASRHLRQLFATGIVVARVDADGLSKYYRLNPTKVSQMQDLLGQLLG